MTATPADMPRHRAPFADTYSRIIEDKVLRHPRSQQTAVGPSELGLPCSRQLLARLAGKKDQRRDVAWKPVIGTAMHAWLEDTFAAADRPTTRFIVEQRVAVGEVAGRPVTGSCDLYDLETGTVADHKIVGLRQIADYRANGPSDQYRTQIMLYAKGIRDGGLLRPPERVAICFLPRDGEWGKRHIWEAPVDYDLADQALARANQLAALLNTVGLEQAQAIYPTCTSPWCWACPREGAHKTPTEAFAAALAT